MYPTHPTYLRMYLTYERDTLSEAAVKNCGHVRDMVDFYNRVSSLEGILEINHVTNVTTVLDETTASDGVSRFMHTQHVSYNMYLICSRCDSITIVWNPYLALCTHKKCPTICILFVRGATPSPMFRIPISSAHGLRTVLDRGFHVFMRIYACMHASCAL